jgi:hypothetical protein
MDNTVTTSITGCADFYGEHHRVAEHLARVEFDQPIAKGRFVRVLAEKALWMCVSYRIANLWLASLINLCVIGTT